jgi:hypothetical protein
MCDHCLASKSDTAYITDIGLIVKKAVSVFMDSLQISGIATARRMGRRQLGVKPTPVRLYVDQGPQIDDAFGPNKRARFIRAAIDRALADEGFVLPDRPEEDLDRDT